MRFSLLFILVFLQSFHLSGQSDEIGSGRAVSFDGIDDYIDLGDSFDAIQLPVTVSAWINLDPAVVNWAPVFISQDNTLVYNGFWLIVTPVRISIGYGDGFGQNDPAFRRSKTVDVQYMAERWVHVAGVIRGATDMDIYVNGINVGGGYTGYSNSPMTASSSDVAKIGYWYSNFQVVHFIGQMDEVRLYAKSLTDGEIRDTMCKKVPVNESGLVGYWTFNETSGIITSDSSPSGVNGVLNNGVSRGFSGAPIGDYSMEKYSPTWESEQWTMGPYTITANDVKGNPEGIHFYGILSAPSQVTGIENNSLNNPYFGVFLASLDNANSFDLVVSENGSPQCFIFTREANDVPAWILEDNPIDDKVTRSEFVFSDAGGQLPVPPNVITPNGDNFNEFFEVHRDTMDKISLQVINRWGREVYFSPDYKNNWNGEDLSAGVYYYIISGLCRDVKGPLSIVR